MDLDHLFYATDGNFSDLRSTHTPGLGYFSSIWQPGKFLFKPPNISSSDSIFYILLHYFKIFNNNDFAVFLIKNGNQVVHRSFVFPKFFRYPFMKRIDLQIGNTWTHPEHRSKGLASFAIRQIVDSFKKPGRNFWYVVHKSNLPSIRVIEKCHFTIVGEGIRSKRFGFRLLGAFLITDRLSSC